MTGLSIKDSNSNNPQSKVIAKNHKFISHINKYGTDFTVLLKDPEFANFDSGFLFLCYKEFMRNKMKFMHVQTKEKSKIFEITRIFMESTMYKGEVIYDGNRRIKGIEELSDNDKKLPLLLKDFEFRLKQQLSYVKDMYSNMIEKGVIEKGFLEKESSEMISLPFLSNIEVKEGAMEIEKMNAEKVKASAMEVKAKAREMELIEVEKVKATEMESQASAMEVKAREMKLIEIEKAKARKMELIETKKVKAREVERLNEAKAKLREATRLKEQEEFLKSEALIKEVKEREVERLKEQEELLKSERLNEAKEREVTRLEELKAREEFVKSEKLNEAKAKLREVMRLNEEKAREETVKSEALMKEATRLKELIEREAKEREAIRLKELIERETKERETKEREAVIKAEKDKEALRLEELAKSDAFDQIQLDSIKENPTVAKPIVISDSDSDSLEILFSSDEKPLCSTSLKADILSKYSDYAEFSEDLLNGNSINKVEKRFKLNNKEPVVNLSGKELNSKSDLKHSAHTNLSNLRRRLQLLKQADKMKVKVQESSDAINDITKQVDVEANASEIKEVDLTNNSENVNSDSNCNSNPTGIATVNANASPFTNVASSNNNSPFTKDSDLNPSVTNATVNAGDKDEPALAVPLENIENLNNEKAVNSAESKSAEQKAVSFKDLIALYLSKSRF